MRDRSPSAAPSTRSACALFPLPRRPSRVLIAGSSGAGKTSLARRIAIVLDVRHVEIGALFHGPDWVPRPSFQADVARFVAGPKWVTEWQYGPVRPLLAERADVVVWLDLSRARVMRQVIGRTLRRRLLRERLWNGNVEPSLRTFLTDPEHIVRWAWTRHFRTAERGAALHAQRPDVARPRRSFLSRRGRRPVA